MYSSELKKIAHANWLARGKRDMTVSEKKNKIAKLLRSGGVNKVAAAMVGPIIVRLAYEGIVRSVLVEDFVPAGTTREYDVLDDMGIAYKLHSSDGRVKIEPFEGKRVLPDYYRIASEWEVKRSDLEFLNVSTIDYAEEQTTQRIMEREDKDLLALLDAAAADWTARHTGPASDGEATANPNTIQNADPAFTLDTFLSGSARIATQRLKGTNLIMNPADVFDIFRWDIKTVGLAFKEDFFAGRKKMSFGDYNIVESIVVPRKTAYMLPDPKYLGVLSVRYGLEAEDDPTGVAEFKIRKVYNELIAQCILNANGVTKLTKN